MAKIGINIATGSLKDEEIIFGIDLGTTNSLISYIDPSTGNPVIVKEADNTALVPSMIYFDESNQPVVGDKAKEQIDKYPNRTIYSIKRLLGKGEDLRELSNTLNYKIIDSNSEEGVVKVQVEDLFYTPIELSSLILSELKSRVKHVMGVDVNKVVITVPAYFNEVQRQATRNAGKLAGMNVLRIINEPTAASLAYGFGHNLNDSQNLAVYDLGGGTFDISILHLENGVFDILSTHGNTSLGGDDFDNAIIEYWQEKYNAPKDTNLKSISEKAKKQISNGLDFEQTLTDKVTLKLTTEEFNEIAKPLIDKTIQSCGYALNDSKLDISEIDEVILVGGATRMPAVQKAVESFFGKKPNTKLHPDEAVALGAAIQGDILAGNNKEFLLLDITPLSLGIETMGGLMDVLIPRNSKVPIGMARQYTTYKDGQNSISIKVYQGERELVKDNFLLGEFVLKGIPSMPAGLPKIEVKFVIDINGLLKVSASELRSGVIQEIVMNPKDVISDELVEKSLKDSIAYAQQDRDARVLQEAIVEAEVLIKTTKDFLIKNKEFIESEEDKKIYEMIDNLELSIGNKDVQSIQNLTEQLNILSTPIATRVMNNAVGQALKGKKIE